MLKITAPSNLQLAVLKLEGKLAGSWVAELEKSWREARASNPCTPLRVDLTSVTFIDSAGIDLLALMYREGAELVAIGCMTKSIVDTIMRTPTQSQNPQPFDRIEKKISVFLLLILLFSLAVLSLAAQEKPPLRLTLRDSIQLALQQNPQVQIATLNVAESEQDHLAARAGLLPQIGFQTFDRAQRFNLEAFVGGRLPGRPQHAGPFQLFQAGPGFSMPVFDLTLWRRWQASHHGVRATEAQATTVREQIVLLVVSQYLGSLRATANVQAAGSRVELAQALYNQAADLQKHGVSTGLDTLRANVQLQNENQQLIVAETQLKTALYGLVRLLNLDPRQTVELADAMSFFETPEFQAEQSLERALVTRPEMRALESQDRIARLQKRAASESRMPKVNASGGWAYQGLSAPAAIPSYQYQLSVDVPLFTGGRIRAGITRADLELKKVAEQKQELRNQIALEVKTGIAQLESARHEVDVANLGVKLSQDEVAQARDRFEAGVANNIEVISAQDALARANDNQIGALYRYNQARADLAHATGQMETLYAK